MTRYQIARSPSGRLTLQDLDSGELLHRYFGPEIEATQLYVEGCGLTQRQGDLRVADIGLGAGFNVLASVAALSSAKQAAVNTLQDLLIESFDLTLNGVQVLLSHLHEFPLYLDYEPQLQELCRAKQVTWMPTSSLRVTWRVHLGDYSCQKQICRPTAAYHAIFFDLFSCLHEPTLWSAQKFAQLYDILSSDGVLATYSSSTAVRANMLASGFSVGEGAFVNAALRGTLATKDPVWLERPLGERWLQRFERSQQPLLPCEPAASRPQLTQRVREHVQFAQLGVKRTQNLFL